MTNTGLPFSLAGKVAVVLGGTAGIGRGISLTFAEAGADVVASGRRQEIVETVAAELEQKGRATLRMSSDVCDRASLEELLRQTLKHFSKVDILVNCAAKISRAPTLSFPEQQWNEILDTNLTGTFRACQIFGSHMLERQYGRIINIASLNSFVALAEVAAYAASKAAVVSLTRSLAVEWSRHGVLVNAIAPGVIRTEFP
jgi:NAD(P)-dependent dehydrogenase (short-subunit alcohol dehydrogenase family)